MPREHRRPRLRRCPWAAGGAACMHLSPCHAPDPRRGQPLHVPAGVGQGREQKRQCSCRAAPAVPPSLWDPGGPLPPSCNKRSRSGRPRPSGGGGGAAQQGLPARQPPRTHGEQRQWAGAGCPRQAANCGARCGCPREGRGGTCISGVPQEPAGASQPWTEPPGRGCGRPAAQCPGPTRLPHFTARARQGSSGLVRVGGHTGPGGGGGRRGRLHSPLLWAA